MSGQSCADTGSCQDDVSVVAKAVWLVMQRRDFKNFERIVEFLELTHEQAPGLVCYRHHARLSAGLRGKIVMNMIEEKRSLLDILEALNCHFPPVYPVDSTAPPRDAAKVQQSRIHFRKLILRMIRDERFRQDYLETSLQAEYGDRFLEALDKLLWEFLYRLQTVLEQEKVPKTTEQSHLGREDLEYTPKLPVSQSNSDKSVTMMQQDRSYLFHIDSSAEEPQNHLPVCVGTHQNCQETELDSARKRDSYDSDQTVIESEGSPETNITRIPSDPICFPNCSRRVSNQSKAVEKSPTQFLDIFSFDCSESSKVNNSEQLSPPNPLQSQETGHNVCLYFDSICSKAKDKIGVSLAEKNSRGGTKLAPHKSQVLYAHEQRNHATYVSGIKNKEQSEVGGHLPQELMSWRFQPKVHLKPLPLALVSKYIHLQSDSIESDSAPSTVSSGLTQSSACTYSWQTDSSVTPDNYNNDPDYYPAFDI